MAQLDWLGLIGSDAALVWLWRSLAHSILLGSGLLGLVWFGLVRFGSAATNDSSIIGMHCLRGSAEVDGIFGG